MKKRKNYLDERQEQKLLQIEHNACWLAVWGLALSMAVQTVRYGIGTGYATGESVLLLCLSVYISVACAKNGIWDRHLKPNVATNLLGASAAGIFVGVLNFYSTFRQYPDKIYGCIAAGVMTGIFCFILCFVTLGIMAQIYRKRSKDLEAEPEEE